MNLNSIPGLLQRCILYMRGVRLTIPVSLSFRLRFVLLLWRRRWRIRGRRLPARGAAASARATFARAVFFLLFRKRKKLVSAITKTIIIKSDALRAPTTSKRRKTSIMWAFPVIVALINDEYFHLQRSKTKKKKRFYKSNILHAIQDSFRSKAIEFGFCKYSMLIEMSILSSRGRRVHDVTLRAGRALSSAGGSGGGVLGWHIGRPAVSRWQFGRQYPVNAAI